MQFNNFLYSLGLWIEIPYNIVTDEIITVIDETAYFLYVSITYTVPCIHS